MSLVDHGLGPRVGQAPGDAHALRRREREVEPGHGTRDPRLGETLLRLDAQHGIFPRRTREATCLGPDAPGDTLGVRRDRPAWCPSELLAGDRVLQHAEHAEQVLLRHLSANRDALSAGQPRQPRAHEPPRWGSRLGVVPGERGRVFGRPVGLRDRAHQVLEPAAEGHPSDRNRHRPERSVGRVPAPPGAPVNRVYGPARYTIATEPTSNARGVGRLEGGPRQSRTAARTRVVYRREH